jgi:hypothetical protein
MCEFPSIEKRSNSRNPYLVLCSRTTFTLQFIFTKYLLQLQTKLQIFRLLIKIFVNFSTRRWIHQSHPTSFRSVHTRGRTLILMSMSCTTSYPTDDHSIERFDVHYGPVDDYCVLPPSTVASDSMSDSLPESLAK